MIPILFKPKTTNFVTNGIGRLSDAISCYVTEERNGAFELELKYPITGLFFENITHSSYIYAETGSGKKEQAFEIYKISKPLNGVVTIYARHVSYQLSYIPCSPFDASGVVEALQGLKDNAAVTCPFEFWTDKTTAAKFAVAVPASIRSRLGGNQDSILDVYGGEYEFDMFTVKLHANRGNDSGVVLRYGKNITDLKQEENIENTVTGICPYWSNTEGKVITLQEKVIMAENAENFPYERVVPVDFSQEFDEIPTETELRQKAIEYVEKHEMGIPSVNITVSFELLWQSEDYASIEALEKLELCDIVTVEYEKLGVNARAKVIKTVYDVLKEKYKSIEVGEAKTTLASTIVAQEKKIDEKPSKGFMDAAVKNATNWITGVNGGYVVLHKNADGIPYEILIMDAEAIAKAKNVWRWNQNGWGYSKNGYNGPYTMAATIDGGFVADFITAGTMLANRIKGGTLQLGGASNGNGVMKILDASGSVVGSWDKDGITATSGEIAGWEILPGQMRKCIDLYDDMTSAGLANVGASDPVQYWVWMRRPTSTSTFVFNVGYKTKTNYLNGSDTVTSYFRVRTDGHFLATRGKIGPWNFEKDTFITDGYEFQITKQSDGTYSLSSKGAANFDGSVSCGKNMIVEGNLSVYGTKNRVVKISDHEKRCMNAYETAEAYFGDIGFSVIGADGICKVEIEEIFLKTISTEGYAVFLQAEGPGEIYVCEKTESYFKVHGTPGTSFAYEIKAKQRGYENTRLERAR